MEFDLQAIKNIYHFLLAVIAAVWYGFPGKKLKVIGVTGTDGKTTTTSLIYHILKSSGKKVSMISTVSAVIAGREYNTGFHVTTPSPFDVQKYLALSVAAGDEYFILETTSHALDQHRVWGIPFEIGLITNITHEHLQYHKTYKRYVEAKSRLLTKAKTRVINRDDRSYDELRRIFGDKKVLTYGLSVEAEFHQDIEQMAQLTLASFNRFNFLAAYVVCSTLGLSDLDILRAIKSFKSPVGRMEVVYDKEFTFIVDFAHTPNAIKEALASVKKNYPNRRIIHIFGAAAFRDDTKRPLMGSESGKVADVVILTEEDYRTEDPEHIFEQIADGLKKHQLQFVDFSQFKGMAKTYTTCVDRQQAIIKAVSVAKKGDIIISTGKGHEQSLCRGKKEYPWDEKQAVQKALKSV